MPLPAGVETVTVSSGEPLTLPDGTVIRGRLLFTGPDVVTISGENVVLGGTVEAELVDGEFSVELVATDAAGMSPSGWTYKVTAVMANAPNWVRYISLPAASPAVTLAAILVPDPVAGEFSTLVSLDGVTAADIGAVPEDRQITAGTGLTGGGTLEADRALAVVFGTTAGTAAQGDDARLSDPRTPTAHAASHAAAGADPVTLTQAQITGLAAALAALAPLAGATFTGVVTIDDTDFVILGTDKGFRFRPTGSALDLEAAGADFLISVWSGTTVGAGTQRSYFRLSADAQNVQLAGKLESVAALYGGAVHSLDPTTGLASLGGKNGLTAIRLAGFKATAGAPAAGTWEAGDVVLASDGVWHLCTAGGEPGTWT
ncbi:hypothetical protein WB388_08615 [Streptomyces brasiliscabiei]|uniref:Uncharacterized protein n=1 Tax=Streptomyces brasiliscabiei TaxID=2736302 RepID=A0ABU8G9S1_9ACTN